MSDRRKKTSLDIYLETLTKPLKIFEVNKYIFIPLYWKLFQKETVFRLAT